MNAIDVEALLQPVSAKEPCGPDLEYDPQFAALEEAATGKPEQQFGDTLIPAQEPDWRDVKKRALNILSRSKDLRVTVTLIRALLNTDGLAGLGEGLALLQGLLERYWEAVHPKPDPDDDYDPTLRMNTLEALCDADSMLRDLRETPLVSSLALGRFNLRDIEIATGRLEPAVRAESPLPELSNIEAAFMDCALEELQAMSAAMEQSLAAVEAIERLATERVEATQAANLGPLANMLKEIRRIVADYLERRGGAEDEMAPVEEAAAEPVADAPEAAAAAGDSGPAPHPLSGEISSRQDVIKTLDKLCEYYRRYEPSSPVPLLLIRARRLVSKNFIDILSDLAPDAVAQVQAISGSGGGEQSSE